MYSNLSTSSNIFSDFTAGLRQLVLDENISYPEYRDRPVEFAQDILGVTWTEPIQAIAKSLLTHNKVAVPAGHAVGKTHGVAGIALWWMCTRHTKTVSTAPTWRQVKDLIWRELRSQHRTAKKTLPGRPYTTDWNLDDDWYATGISTNDPTRFQGYHSEELLVLLDEASGVEKSIWAAIEDGLAVSEGNRILAIGNPTDPTGRFAQVCRSSDWKVFPLSCLDHPNVKSGRSIIKGAVTKSWIEDRIRRWCVPYMLVDGTVVPPDVFEYQEQYYMPNDLFRVRILGQFPVEGGSAVFPLHIINAAFYRNPMEPVGPPAMGMDCARFGDDLSVLVMGGSNGVVTNIDAWQGARTTESAGRVKFWNADMEKKLGRMGAIAVDGIGVGSGVVDDLVLGNYPVIDVNVASKPSDDTMYQNLRDEVTFSAASLFSQGTVDLSRVRNYEEMISEELSAITYDYTNKGQRKIAPKEEVKKKIGRSPDFADSLCLYLFYCGSGRITGEVVRKADSWGDFEA